MAEAGTQPKRSFRPAWRKDGGSFGAPTTPKQEDPRSSRTAPPGGPRQPFGAPPVTSDWQTNGAPRREQRPRASSGLVQSNASASDAEAPSQRIRKAPKLLRQTQLLKLRKRTVLLEHAGRPPEGDHVEPPSTRCLSRDARR